ncbi:MAG TPA: hypothetical protein DEV93_11440 [Chloroflexi bacterium]|nr:hypothetical protein [Chloroflexota bacterium]
MTVSARCLHVDIEGLVKGNRFSYRAHVKVSGDESLDETADDLIVQFREDESWPRRAGLEWNDRSRGPGVQSDVP